MLRREVSPGRLEPQRLFLPRACESDGCAIAVRWRRLWLHERRLEGAALAADRTLHLWVYVCKLPRCRARPSTCRRGWAIVAAGARLRYLPAYSPDFNPIEQAFAKLVALLQTAAARTVSDSCAAIRDAFTRFRLDECRLLRIRPSLNSSSSRCAVRQCDVASSDLTRQEEDGLRQALFTAAPA